jgi:hypothetical protein
MRLEFDLETRLSPDVAYDFFRTPADWPRLFPAFRPASQRGDGWFTVPMRRSPIPLVANNTADEPGRRVAWDLAGFWKGDGEVRFEAIPDGTRVTGYEEVALPRLLGLGRLIGRGAEPRFASVWEGGWRRLRRMDPDASAR